MKTRKIVIIALFATIGAVLSYFENLIPLIVSIPGVKLGFASVVTLAMIFLYGYKEAFLVLIVRIFLVFLIVGNLYSLLFALSGGVISFLLMSIIHYFFKNRIHITTISVVGSVAHNITQILVAALILEQINLFYYLSFLIISGVIMGVITGTIAKYFIIKMKTIFKQY